MANWQSRSPGVFARARSVLFREHHVGDLPIRRRLGDAEFKIPGAGNAGTALSGSLGFHNPTPPFLSSLV